MKIRIPVISYAPLLEKLLNILPPLEDALNSAFKDESYDGEIGQLTVNIVAVDADASENAKWSKPRNKVGSFQDPFTDKRLKYISIALPFDPTALEGLGDRQILHCVCEELTVRLDNIGVRLPKTFKHQIFFDKLKTMLRIYDQAARED